ncbi:alpha/beta fold hydrolase [Cellulomonas gelida]|uniref:Alpha/beta hydrolase n=1 Tax=Cellulomonas gelida TaxID=1712 RepID=A0A4Y3KHC0_9CELL|nr:alpha/beta hydrolase [Cellulomonas gelida]GEA83293.1 alpha/beta hydrolase [Cellulomonas gelida]GGL13298.1 alpha/beta hydrolase [Cellulomonas gelida]
MTLHVLREARDDRPPIVLLHGFPLDHRMWAATAAELVGSHEVLAADVPGAAGPDAGRGEPSLDTAADRLAAALADRGVDRAVVVGLSMGGYVALALAERHPALVAALGLVDTKSTADTEEARAHRLRVADEAERTGTVEPVRAMATSLVGESTRAAQPEVSDQLAQWIEEQTPAGVAWAQRAMAARPDRTDVLAAFTGPVTVVVGDEDTVTPVAAAEHMVAASPAAQLVVVPHSGHMSAVEQPAAVAAALSDLAQRAASA